MTKHDLCKAVWVVGLVSMVHAGCSGVGLRESMTVATNDKWRVVASGRLDAPQLPFTTHAVEFEVFEGSRSHSRGPLYEAGAMDAGFKERFTRPQWVGENALRFWPPERPERRQYRLSVSNRGTRAAKWLRISALPDQVYLLLELAPQSAVTLPLLESGNAPLLDVEGQNADGHQIQPQELRLDRYWPSVSLTLRDGALMLQRSEAPADAK